MSGYDTAMAQRIFCETMERMAFVFADPVDPAGISDGGIGKLAARMEVRGHCCGAIVMAAPMSLGLAISENLLGPASSESWQTLAADAICEALNVFCGGLLEQMAGDAQEAFELSAPVSFPLTDDEWRKMRQSPHTLAFVVEDFPLLLQIEIADKERESSII